MNVAPARAFLYRRAAREERGAERGRTGERSRRRRAGRACAIRGLLPRRGKKEGRQSRDARRQSEATFTLYAGFFLLHSNEPGRKRLQSKTVPGGLPIAPQSAGGNRQ